MGQAMSVDVVTDVAAVGSLRLLRGRCKQRQLHLSTGLGVRKLCSLHTGAVAAGLKQSHAAHRHACTVTPAVHTAAAVQHLPARPGLLPRMRNSTM